MEISSCHPKSTASYFIQESPSPIRITRTDSTQQTAWCEVKTPSHEVHCRYHHSSVLINNKYCFLHDFRLYIYGGFQTNHGILSDFKVFQNFVDQTQWRNLPTENGPGTRHSHSSIYYKGNIYIFGGKINIMQNTNTVHAFNIESQAWRQIETKNNEEGPLQIDSHQAFLYQDQMIVVGGFLNNCYTNNIYSLNLETLEWRKIYETGSKEKQPTPRSDFSLIQREGKLYIFGGKFSEGMCSDFWEFNLQTRQYSEIPLQGKISEPRSGHTAVLYENRMVVFGGITGVTHERNDLLEYNFQDGEWRVIWENTQKQKQRRESQDMLKLKSSKKNSINSKIRDGEKSKTYSRCFQSYKANTETMKKKYRRTLKEQMMENQVTNKKVEADRFKKSNEKKMLLLHEFEPNSSDKFPESNFSPLIETLTNSIVLTSHNGGCQKPSTSNQNNAPFIKTLKPRDGHTAHVLEKGGRMIIFGGDRHTIGFNDVIIVNLEEILFE